MSEKYSTCYLVRRNCNAISLKPIAMPDHDFTFVHSGRLLYRIDNGDIFTVNAGEGMFVKQGHIRERIAIPEKTVYTSMIIDHVCSIPYDIPSHVIINDQNDVIYCLDNLLKYYNFPRDKSGTIISCLIEYLLCILDSQNTSKPSNRYISLMIDYISKNWNGKVDLEAVSESAHISKSYASYLFKNETGMALVDYITDLRIKRASEMLKYSHHSISEIAELTGFCDMYYFSRVFKKKTGSSPRSYCKNTENYML